MVDDTDRDAAGRPVGSATDRDAEPADAAFDVAPELFGADDAEAVRRSDDTAL
ncbi:hypothetical protein HZS55_01905 [Halosimplex rubrum]|uniref:Uncharacterized protein n=1 Tax=Halosimplex rubrum TaxID=869889 RepID=A0A7D5T3P7_9EURY|nr:hypothetical protein [Halosimplex rubrum]QLH76133.1 hypothetical protein HZS55_01905 [Halosimplex rubrum]